MNKRDIIKPNEMIPGHYYRIVYDSLSKDSTIFTAIAKTNDQVQVYTRNGENYNYNGTVSSSKYITEITKEHAIHGTIYASNRDASTLLQRGVVIE